jgi:hypothetical protein
MSAILRSSAEGRRIELTTAIEQPALVPFTPAESWKGQESTGLT